MRFPAFLLRLLLCFSLMLNGWGYAFASTEMQVSHMATAVQAASAAAHPAAPPCHSMEQGGLASMHVAQEASPHAAPAKHGGPDCCEASLCACDCLQHASLAMPEALANVSVELHAVHASRVAAGHSAPALADLIRPPIG